MLLVRSALRSARVPGWQQVVAQAVPSQLKSKAAVVIDYVASARAATATTSSLLLSQYASALVRQLPRGTTAVSSFNSATLASSRIARNDGDDDGRRIPSAAETQTRRIPGIERGTPGTKTRTPDAASPSSSIDTRQRTPAAPVIRSADIATANSKYHKTRLPIVMCHGLFGFDKVGICTRRMAVQEEVALRLHHNIMKHTHHSDTHLQIGPEAIPALQMHYWTGLADSLRSTGCEVYIARVPAGMPRRHGLCASLY